MAATTYTFDGSAKAQPKWDGAVVIKFRGVEIDARRPTHAECDLGALMRFVGILSHARSDVAKSSEAADVDAMERAILRGSRAGARVRERVAKSLRAIAPAQVELAARLEADDADGKTTDEAVEFFMALLAALEVDPASLGKS